MMVLLQLSANTGPEECCLAVRKALAYLSDEATRMQVRVKVVEQVAAERVGNLRSALLALDGENARALALRWHGGVQWICASPYRSSHPRKNWFISANIFECDDAGLWNGGALHDKDLRFESMRAGGPGGQHVNTTDSAVRATHIPSGLSVKVRTERSQHANKRLARALIVHKLGVGTQNVVNQSRAERHLRHQQGDRGNAGQIFRGEAFVREV